VRKVQALRAERGSVRILGVVLVVAALGGWLVSGAPRPGGATFGDVPANVAVGASGGHTGASPVPEVPAVPELRPATPVEAAPAPTAPGPATSSASDEDAPGYTTTAPRGAIDPQRWPASVRVPALDVIAPVQVIGVGPAGALIVPHSPMDVGWYQGGSVPGEPGVALLTSHVDTRTEGRGVFAGLVRLAPGDTITLVAADGIEQLWTVTARTQHRKDALPSELFARSGPPVLALVTCGGPFDPQARSYRDNVIVWATPSPTGSVEP
jgi:sortase (surface protein transpeptidase)